MRSSGNSACALDGRADRQRPARSAALGCPVAVRIVEALERLATTGQGDVQRLRGTTDEWRLRVGDWRVRFRYDTAADTIEVLHILPRGESYR